MIYEYKCNTCKINWDVHKPLKEYDSPSICKTCGKKGNRVLSAIPWFFRKTHPDVKQDMHELVAGEPASNFTEL